MNLGIDAEGLNRRCLIAGGAGFIGSHFVDRLLDAPGTEAVCVYDNFSSGRHWHLSQHGGDPRLRVIEADINDTDRLTAAMAGHDTVLHLASNPDLARAVSDPDVDFREGTVLTRNILEAMRLSGAKRVLYASGSGVYGDIGDTEAAEDQGGMLPISTYGASKLAGEALISSYCHMFGITGRCFRFGNVVGPRQTHGIGYDFVRKLRDDPTRLDILGDGSQSKSYIHVDDTVAAVLHAHRHGDGTFQVYNVATGDYVTVREIAQLALEAMGLRPDNVELTFGDDPRGWQGDVPVVRLNTDRIRGIGWQCALGAEAAMRRSLRALIEDMECHG